MRSDARRRAFVTGCAALALCGQGDPNPDASVWIEEVRVGLFGHTGSFGGGRLRFGDEVHRFSIDGLEAVGTGITSVRAQGEVFNLRRLADFAGTYTEHRDGPAEGPVEVHWLRNARGVRMRLRSSRSGATLRISEGGLIVTLED
ncbi:hypothetical protein [Falsiroseomonas oryziterrae]|uniref:hypothetical protein n=1 Tax=Falsiroseomonas oryziterrae TaxID=2911368 RepID=UPI001F3E980D|nr:hypothetical protein [Roseomonas sp. NPKOSM-4]